MDTRTKKRHRKADEPALAADSQTAPESVRGEVVQILASAVLRRIIEGPGTRALDPASSDAGGIP